MLLNFVYSTYMNEDNRKYIWACIQKAGDYLDGQLPSHPNHPKGRNPYAHVFERIKSKMGGRSYAECEDWEAKRILNIIEYYTKNPC